MAGAMRSGEILMHTASASATPPTAGARLATTLQANTASRRSTNGSTWMPYMAAPIWGLASIAKASHAMISRESRGRAILTPIRNIPTSDT